jgi:hypothetical protein
MAQDVEAFVAEVLPRIRAAQEAIYAGDSASWRDYWSSGEPVSWLGQLGTCAYGVDDVAAHYSRVAARVTYFDELLIEVLVADVSGQVGYLVTRERTTVRIDGHDTNTPPG